MHRHPGVCVRMHNILQTASWDGYITHGFQEDAHVPNVPIKGGGTEEERR